MATHKNEAMKRKHRAAALQRQEIVAQLFKRGYTYTEIRHEVMARLDLPAYSLSTVCKDVNTLLAEWRECRIDNLDYALQLELQRIDDLIKEAWEAWEKSKEDTVARSSKQKGIPAANGEGGNEEEGVVTIAMEQTQKELHPSGDPRYLDMIHKLLIERRKLLGLYAPERREFSHQGNIGVTMNREEIEAELKRLRILTEA